MNLDKSGSGAAGNLWSQALAHGGMLLLLAWVFVLLDAPDVEAGAGWLCYLAAIAAFLLGMAVSHIVHEWCHFLGAVLAGSAYRLKPAIHPLFFDFDYAVNTARQFLAMSAGGPLGNILLVLALLAWLEPQSVVEVSFFAAAVGQLVYVMILELPVSRGVLAGQEPLAALTAHFGQGGPLFLRATLGGLLTAALVFWLWLQ